MKNRYLQDMPKTSRAAREQCLKTEDVRKNLPKVRALHAIAGRRDQSLAQMAIAWVLRLPNVTSALIGASSPAQMEQNVKALDYLDFSKAELAEIDQVLIG